jgi:hypothetical protein
MTPFDTGTAPRSTERGDESEGCEMPDVLDDRSDALRRDTSILQK